jgi:hypothetical protein
VGKFSALGTTEPLHPKKKKTRRRGRGRRNKIARVFGLPVELIINLSVFFFFLALWFDSQQNCLCCAVGS